MSKIVSYSGNKIRNFNTFVGKDNYMNDVLNKLKSQGVSFKSYEAATYEAEGYIELSDLTQISVTYDKKLYGCLELPNKKYATTSETTDVSQVLSDLKNLCAEHSINESDYTSDFRSTVPQKPSAQLKMQRADKVASAVKHIESAINELKHTPKIDWMDDIPDAIAKLEEFLGDEESGLIALSKIYRKEK